MLYLFKKVAFGNRFQFAYFAGFFAFSLAHSADASDFWSARTASLGGAGHAAPLLNDAIYLNPSYVSFLPTYALATNYAFYSGGNTQADGSSELHGHELNFSIQDGRSELFQAGVGLTMREDATFVNIGASKAIMKQLGVGLGGKFVFPTDNQAMVRDMVLAVSGVPVPWIQLSLTVDNLVESDAAKAINLYRQIVLGTKFNIQGIIFLYLDPHLTPDLPGSSYGHELGVEFTIFQDLFLRMGNFHNALIPIENQYGNGFSTGLGWMGPRLTLEYALIRPEGPIPATAHEFGATIFL